MKTIKDTDYGDLTGKKYTGNIDLYKQGIESMEGFPDMITGDLLMQGNNLKSLKGSPRYVGGDCYFDTNDIESLEGAPKEIGGKFSCQRNYVKNSIEQICKYQIKAKGYFISEQNNAVEFEEIEEQFNNFKLNNRVTRPSMRKLLGLK